MLIKAKSCGIFWVLNVALLLTVRFGELEWQFYGRILRLIPFKVILVTIFILLFKIIDMIIGDIHASMGIPKSPVEGLNGI